MCSKMVKTEMVVDHEKETIHLLSQEKVRLRERKNRARIPVIRPKQKFAKGLDNTTYLISL